jgi:hypothetical protein
VERVADFLEDLASGGLEVHAVSCRQATSGEPSG